MRYGAAEHIGTVMFKRNLEPRATCYITINTTIEKFHLPFTVKNSERKDIKGAISGGQCEKSEKGLLCSYYSC